jgi:tyrosyl-tRNA synthetase
MDALDTLRERGFVQQVTHEDELRARLNAGPVTVYAGFDPTASSLHVGHLLPIFCLAWLQRMGHRVIAVVGGGTGRIGDPSGKTEMRNLLDDAAIEANVVAIRAQIERYLDLSDPSRGVLVDNASWLLGLGYVSFLRDIGRHFSVNRMLAAEAYKARLERGLSFIEFNYQILQAYDFLVLARTEGCTLQIGGDDQWGNIVAGVDLIRRVDGTPAFGLTLPLLTTASGAKMGKTASGAVWLDAERFSAFDFHQYWLNVDDADVGRLLRMFTFLPMEEVRRLEALVGADVREAKRVLAREATTLCHGAAAAAAAEAAGRAMVAGEADADLPTLVVDRAELDAGQLRVTSALVSAGVCASRGEAKRLLAGGGGRLNGARIDGDDRVLGAADFVGGGAVVRVGKKRAVRLILAE